MMPLGFPVVPDEYRIHSGWLKLTGVVGSQAVVRSLSSSASIVARNEGSPVCSASMSARLSWILPPYW